MRFDRLDIATSDLADAMSVYQNNFGFIPTRAADADEASITLGDAQLRLRSGPAVADLISSSGEGLAAVWLEADDIAELAKTLEQAGVAASPLRVEGGRRILAVEPKSANMVPLFIFDQKDEE